MANTKVLKGDAPTPTKSEGVKISNSSNRGNRAATRTSSRATKIREEKVELPEWGVEDQVWMWRANGSGTFTIPSTYNVVIPDKDGKKRQERIMYSEGAPDIEWSKLSQYNETPLKTPIRMRNSMLHVPADNATLQQYLTYLAYYGNYNDIYLDDPEREARKEAEVFELIDANVDTIREMDVVSLRAVASALKIGVDAVMPKSAIQNAIRKKNNTNPELVAKALQDDVHENYFIASEVITTRLAELSNGSLLWEDGSPILKVPDNFTAKDYLGSELINNQNVRDAWLVKFKEALQEIYP